MTVSTFNATYEGYFQYTFGSWPAPVNNPDAGGTGFFLCNKGNFGGTYVNGVGLLAFNTAAIPDTDVVTAARIIATPSNLERANGSNIVADYSWDGTASSNDWAETVGTTALTAFDYSTLTVGVQGSIPLTGVSGISKTGSTYIRVGHTVTDSSGLGMNRINLNTAHVSAIQLEVTHGPPSSKSSALTGLSGMVCP